MLKTLAPTKKMAKIAALSKKQCRLCNRPMPAVGYARKNGAAHRDWLGRKSASTTNSATKICAVKTTFGGETYIIVAVNTKTSKAHVAPGGYALLVQLGVDLYQRYMVDTTCARNQKVLFWAK